MKAKDYIAFVMEKNARQLLRFASTFVFWRKKPGIPDKIVIVPTYKCNLRCDGCFEAADKQSMSAALFRDTLYKSREVRNIILMGGELLYKGSVYFDEIVKFRENHKMNNIIAITNGTLLTEDIVRVCAEKHIILFFSIDGSGVVHDGRRGLGCFASIKRNMAMMNKRRMIFGVITTVTKNNFFDVLTAEYLSLIHKLGASFLIFLPYLSNEANREFAPQLSMSRENIEQIDRFVDYPPIAIAEFGVYSTLSYESRNGGCQAGSNMLSINPTGDVLCCVQMGYSSFNIADGALADIPKLNYYKEVIEYTCQGGRPCMIRDGVYKLIMDKLEIKGGNRADG